MAGVDLSLSANHGAEDQFRRAIACDEALAVAHVALARTLQVQHQPDEAKAAAARARELASALPHRERSHVNALATVIDGGSVAGLAAVKEHLATYPRDAMVLAPCTGVFGLIGFSGRAGREAELLALLDPLADAYGDDWWFESALAFAQAEVGEIERAHAIIERSLALHPRNANAAHIRSHVYYEAGEREAGLAYLEEWWPDYPKESLLHCHLSWHIALWQLALGKPRMRGASTAPTCAPASPPGRRSTRSPTPPRSCCARRWRARARPELWRELSQYATQWFPSPGIAFADVHGAGACVAGDAEALAKIIERAKGPARDAVAPLARAFGAFSRSDWAEAAAQLQAVSDCMSASAAAAPSATSSNTRWSCACCDRAARTGPRPPAGATPTQRRGWLADRGAVSSGA
jgi:tetratricopeptide (TPR) repeat protein